MNPFAVLIPLFLFCAAALDLIADWLNLRHLQPDLPEEFSDVYDAERYRRSQTYTRDRTRLGMIENGVTTAFTIVFIVFGGLRIADGLARGCGFGLIGTGLVFTGILVLLASIVGLPFSIYSTFVIEARYGFNTTTARTFLADRVKGVLLAVLLGGPILALVYWFFSAAGGVAWIYAWLAISVFQLVVMFLAPILILPLFNKFIPLPEGNLRRAIEEYARAQGLAVSGIFTMDGSKRSSKANAFFTGFGRFRRIVLFDTLVKNHATDELVAVLAHETGHYRLRHIPLMLGLSIAQAGLLCFLLSLFIDSPVLARAFGLDAPSVYAGLVGFGLLYTPLGLALGLAMNAIARRHEYAADLFAARTTGSPSPLISALKKLGRDTLSNLTPHPLKVALAYSHPPLPARLAALRRAGDSH